jgi:Ca2+-binding RTX toxin-like protein
VIQSLTLPEQITLGSAATQASHRFIYNPVSGALFFDPDGTGLMAQIQMATLRSGLALSHTDIFVTA